MIKDDPVAEKVESTIKNVKTIMNRIFQALGIEKIKLEDIKQLKERFFPKMFGLYSTIPAIGSGNKTFSNIGTYASNKHVD